MATGAISSIPSVDPLSATKEDNKSEIAKNQIGRLDGATYPRAYLHNDVPDFSSQADGAATLEVWHEFVQDATGTVCLHIHIVDVTSS